MFSYSSLSWENKPFKLEIIFITKTFLTFWNKFYTNPIIATN